MTTVDASPATRDLSEPALRRAFGQFATGVAVVTTAGPDGRAGLTVNSIASVSLRPPILLWCLRRESAHLDAFSDCGTFAVNVLAADQELIARVFASGFTDRFQAGRWDTGDDGVPLLHGALARITCRRLGTPAPVGDHVVVYGEVRAHETLGGEPLVFARSAFHRLHGHHE